MDFKKIKPKQIVLIIEKSTSAKRKGEVIDIFPASVIKKIPRSSTQVEVESLDMGLGFNLETNNYDGCFYPKGWCLSKNHQEDKGKTVHKDHVFLLEELIKNSNKLHKLTPGSKTRTYLFRAIPGQLKTNHHIQLASINTKLKDINGTVVRIISNDRKKGSPWIFFSDENKISDVLEWMQKYVETF